MMNLYSLLCAARVGATAVLFVKNLFFSTLVKISGEK